MSFSYWLKIFSKLSLSINSKMRLFHEITKCLVVNHDDLLPSGMVVLTLSVSVVVQPHFGLEAAFSAVKTLQSLDFVLPKFPLA